GPSLSVWYRFLDHQVRGITPPWLNVTTRVAIDQLCFSPVSVATFFSVNTYLETHDLEKVKDKLHQQYWKALVSNWKVWTCVQFVNFAMVPLHHRLLVVNLIALGWNAYMSHLNTT
ncbi:Protein required for ethanol metabolism, partial [Coelomomyces lativittatus]